MIIVLLNKLLHLLFVERPGLSLTDSSLESSRYSTPVRIGKDHDSSTLLRARPDAAVSDATVSSPTLSQLCNYCCTKYLSSQTSPVNSEMAILADPGTTSSGLDEDQCLASPALLLRVEESLRTGGRETEKAAPLTPGEESGEAPEPATTATLIESAIQEAVSASGTIVGATVAAGVEQVGDSAAHISHARPHLVASVEEPAQAAASTPQAGTAGKSRKRLSLVARQSARGAELRRKSVSDKVAQKGGDKPAWRRASKPAAESISGGEKSAKTPKRASLVARQTTRGSAGLRIDISGNDSGTTKFGSKPASRGEPRPVTPGATVECMTPRRLSLVARQTEAGASRRSTKNRSSAGWFDNAAKPDPVRTPRSAKTMPARVTGEITPKRTSLVARQTSAGVALRSKLAPGKVPGLAVTATPSGSAGAKAKPGNRLSLVSRQSAGSSSSTTLVAKSNGTPTPAGDCPEIPSVVVPGTWRALGPKWVNVWFAATFMMWAPLLNLTAVLPVLSCWLG